MNLVRPNPGKTNDGCPAALVQLVKCAIVFRNDFLEHLRRDGDFAVSVRWSNENNSPANFNVWRFLGKITVHLLFSPLLNPVLPEQGEIGTNPENKRKPLPHVTSGFMRTALFLRQADATCPTLGRAA